MASLKINLFIQPGRQGRSQDFLLPRRRKFRPEAAKRFWRILVAYPVGVCGLSISATWPIRTRRVENCYPTRSTQPSRLKGFPWKWEPTPAVKKLE